MPFGRRSLPVTVPSNAREWRPQEPGDGSARSIADPILEPYWDGLHVLAHLEAGSVVFVDADGLDRSEDFPDEAAALVGALGAGDAIVDGFLTLHSMIVEGTGLALPKPPSLSEHTKRMLVGEHSSDRLAIPASPQGEDVTFVAVDLLAIDGERLLDVPLLERRRVLEGAVSRTETVSVTPYAQAPGESFIRSSRIMGFWALIYKAANSRYAPGSRSDEWAVWRIPVR